MKDIFYKIALEDQETLIKSLNANTINLKKGLKLEKFIYQNILGIILTGTEIKSIRDGKASLVDTFCYVKNNNEVWMNNSYVAPYDKGWYIKQEERRPRKLLLNKNEIKRLGKESKIPGITIVPIRMFINDRGLCKVEIALCKGKKEYDKRESIKKRDLERESRKMI